MRKYSSGTVLQHLSNWLTGWLAGWLTVHWVLRLVCRSVEGTARTHAGTLAYWSPAQSSPAWPSTPLEPVQWGRRWRAMLRDRLSSSFLPLGGSLWLLVQPRPEEQPPSCLCWSLPEVVNGPPTLPTPPAAQLKRKWYHCHRRTPTHKLLQLHRKYSVDHR